MTDTKKPQTEASASPSTAHPSSRSAGIHLNAGSAPDAKPSAFETFRKALCQNGADDTGRGGDGHGGPMRLTTSADFWTAVQWLRKWSVVHASHHLSSFLAILIAFFDDWRGSPEEAAALQTGGFGGIVLDLRALYSRRADDLDDSAALAGLEGNFMAMAGFHATALYLRANVNLCDAVRRIVRSRTWSPLISDAWELAVDDLVRAAAIDRGLEQMRRNGAEDLSSQYMGPVSPEEVGLFCGGFTQNLPDAAAGCGGTRDEAISVFLAVVEDQRIAGDAVRTCWKDGCLERVERGAIGCAAHPFGSVAREAEPSVRLRFAPRDLPFLESFMILVPRGHEGNRRSGELAGHVAGNWIHQIRDVEPAGSGLWWAHAEFPRSAAEPNVHVRVVASSMGAAVELAQTLETIPPAFVLRAMGDRAFLVLAPDEVTALAALFAKGGSK